MGDFPGGRSSSLSNNTSPSQLLILKNQMAPVRDFPVDVYAKDQPVAIPTVRPCFLPLALLFFCLLFLKSVSSRHRHTASAICCNHLCFLNQLLFALDLFFCLCFISLGIWQHTKAPSFHYLQSTKCLLSHE